MILFRTASGAFMKFNKSSFRDHRDIDNIAAIRVTAADGYEDLEVVRNKYPAFCSTYEDQVYFGDIAKMILVNCFLPGF